MQAIDQIVHEHKNDLVVLHAPQSYLKGVKFRRERRVLKRLHPPVQSAAHRAGLPRLPPKTQSAKTSSQVTKVARVSCLLLQITSYQLYALRRFACTIVAEKRRILWPNERSQVMNSGGAFKRQTALLALTDPDPNILKSAGRLSGPSGLQLKGRPVR